jgi:DNA-binding NarL/FixJ family response regulator
MASRATAQALDRLDVRRSPTSKTPLRILIADDHEIVRRGVRTVLSSHPGWEVCAEAATGQEAVAKAKQHKPDIVVMDISMPELNGLEAARKICKMLPNTEVVILSFHFSDQLVRDVWSAAELQAENEDDTQDTP